MLGKILMYFCSTIATELAVIQKFFLNPSSEELSRLHNTVCSSMLFYIIIWPWSYHALIVIVILVISVMQVFINPFSANFDWSNNIVICPCVPVSTVVEIIVMLE
jgi:membrane protein YdbS with pleckstrin-like domain